MAVLPVNLYRDFLLSQVETPLAPGIAAAFGATHDLSNWTEAGNINGNKIYTITGDVVGDGGLILSGGGTIYNSAIAQSVPWLDDAVTDWRSNEYQYPTIYNPQFFGAFEYEGTRYCTGIGITAAIDYGSQIAWRFRLYTYTQTPDDAAGNTRQTWQYWSGFYDDSYYDGKRCVIDNSSVYTLVKVYTLYIDDEEFFLFALGVAADNSYFKEHGSIFATLFIAINKDLWKDKEVRPWAGPESEDTADTSFSPTTPYRGDISSRDLTGKTNPYGFNTGNGLCLCIIEQSEYAAILQGIYAGTAESVLNKLSQGFAQIVGGNTHRPLDEVQAITNAILSCHMIPQITGYVTGSHTLKTIAGYHVLGGNGDSAVSMSLWKTTNTIFNYDSDIAVLSRRLNCYLDYEPYTSIKLHLPFMPVVDIPPSVLWGNGLQLHYTIDIYTGILSCDIIIHDYGNESERARNFVLTTVQTNCKTDIPIMGNAAQAGIFGGLASAIVGTMGGEGGATGALGLGLDILSKISTGNAAGKMSVDGIGAYMSNRTPALIITRPKPSNPKGFLELQGGMSNLGGKVGDFEGYAEFATVDLTEIAATEQEKREIETALKGGVFV